MDKAYVDFDALFRFHLAGAYWVTRPKENMKYEILGHRGLSDAVRNETRHRASHPPTAFLPRQ